jgi:cytochrome c-type biogenesis protein CcmE
MMPLSSCQTADPSRFAEDKGITTKGNAGQSATKHLGSKEDDYGPEKTAAKQQIKKRKADRGYGINGSGQLVHVRPFEK